MTDFSINRTTTASGVNSSSSKESEFSKLKKEYDAFVRKIGKSDFANSPTTIQKRRELLDELKALAETEALSDELEWIEKEEQSLKTADEALGADLPYSAPYYKPLAKTEDNIPMDIESVLENCKDTNGKYDKGAVRIVMAFKDATQKDEYFIPYIVKKCRELDGSIPDKTVEAIEALAAAGVKAPFLSRTIDSFLSADDSEEPINVNLFEKMLTVKSLGFDDKTALKLSRLLNSGYSDDAAVLKSVKKLLSADLPDNVVFDILKALTVKDKENGEKSINPEAVNAVVQVKNILRETQANEKRERLSKIYQNNMPVQLSLDGETAILMDKKGTFQTVSLKQYDTVQEAKQAYDNLINQTENNMLLEFIRKYKNTDGSIDNKYLRIIYALRRYDITHEGLFDLTDLCIDKAGNMDKNSLGAISLLKSKGALSKDISEILSSIERDYNGVYNPEELETACDLSSAVLGQPYLTKLLPDAKKNNVAKNFIMAASPYFDKKSNLVKLINLVKPDGQSIDDVSLEIADDILFSENNDKTESEFIKYIAELLKLSRGSEKTASEAAEQICCSIDVFSPDEVLSLVKACLDSKGNVDKKLADAVYKLYHEGFGSNVIIEKINACKNGDSIDYDKLNNMI